ncbi:RNA-directed DNA polymerase, eukaryota [Tanacetum coccineum]|uniref:RNA-directed DNA polymerase, eukaryota n=1 Tax=Tanacetum coccineum TaxID=301880 RepID=A0ABQ4ZT20_9ASTR
MEEIRRLNKEIQEMEKLDEWILDLEDEEDEDLMDNISICDSNGISKMGHYSWDAIGGTSSRWDTRGGTTEVGHQSLVIVFVMGLHHQNSLQSKLDQTAKDFKISFRYNFSEEVKQGSVEGKGDTVKNVKGCLVVQPLWKRSIKNLLLRSELFGRHEGVPLNAWSHPSLKKIGSIWGEMVDLEEGNDSYCEEDVYASRQSHGEYFRDKRGNSIRSFGRGEMSANSAPHVNLSAVSKSKEGGSILEILKEMITVGQTMGFSMEGCVKDIGVNFWNSGGTRWNHLYMVTLTSSKKDNHIISDNFVALYGTWIPNNMKLLLISVYAPQVRSSKRLLWNYLSSLIIRWKGECLVMGDFNEVRSIDERWGSTFNKQGADLFNSFISSSGLIDIQMEGYSFTWAHPSASKMSKLDRFLLSNGLLSFFPHLSAVCLDRHLSDHMPILLKEVHSDFGPTPFRFFHSWLDLPGFDELMSCYLGVGEGTIRDLNLNLSDIDKTWIRRRLQMICSFPEEFNETNSNLLFPLFRAAFLPNRQILDGPFIINKMGFLETFLLLWFWSSNVFLDPRKLFQCLLFSFVFQIGLLMLVLLKVTSFGLLSNILFAICSIADDAGVYRRLVSSNLKGIMHILRCFSILSGMTINFQKSQLLGVGICDNHVIEAAKFIGCSTMKTPFRYLGILVGDNMANLKAWDETIAKMIKRLSKWKLNTLSIGGRLTLLKSVLGSTPIYNMSIYKVPKLVLNHMERLRRDFFYGVKDGDRKIAWIKWTKVLASKKFGGLGVSSLFALNRALIFKWVWRFLSHDNSLWSRVIAAVHGSSSHPISAAYNSPWGTIIKEVKALNDKDEKPARCANVYSEVQTSRLNFDLPLPSVLKSSFDVVDGPKSSAAGNPVNLGEISAISRISDLENISDPNLGNDILGDIGRDIGEILISARF